MSHHHAEDTPLVVDAPGVLANDVTAGDPLTAVKDSDPTNGALALDTDGSFVYTPTQNWNGVDSFTYHANNGTADSNLAMVTITVTAVNDDPTFASTPITVAVEDKTYTYAITASDVDVGDNLIITAPTRPTWLNLADNGDGSATLSGTPGRADVGDHPVILQVRDTGGLTGTQSFTITVAAETIPPEVSSTTPTDGAADVARNVPVVVSFSEEMLTSTVTTLITPSVAAIVETWSNGDTRLTINHDNFAANTRYTATVTGNDLAGNPLDPTPTTWTFTTGTELVPEADLALAKVRHGNGVVTAGLSITYTFTVTNSGPTSPITATVVDTFDDATALAGVTGQGCVWPGAAVVTCTVTTVVTDTPSALTLIVTTNDTYSGTLANSATVAPAGTVVDPNWGNNHSGPVAVDVRTEVSGVYLPLVLRSYGG